MSSSGVKRRHSPTIEAGYPNSDYNFWMGSHAPAKTPPEIVQRVNAEVRKALDA
jgi:tripartite-type tricarboxylate transporter receptor subunit TctC